MSYVYFIRHGETTDNLKNVHPHDGTALTEQGVRDIEARAATLAHIPFTAVYLGTSVRAAQTAELLLYAFGSLPVIPDAVFNERQFLPPEESIEDFMERTRALLECLASLPPGTYALVSHAGIMKAVTARLASESADTIKAYRNIEARYTVKSAGVMPLHLGEEGWRLLPDEADYLVARES